MVDRREQKYFGNIEVWVGILNSTITIQEREILECGEMGRHEEIGLRSKKEGIGLLHLRQEGTEVDMTAKF